MNKYLKSVRHLNHIDIYRICWLYDVQDSSGALHHAIKKILCAGSRGYKNKCQDITEAREALDRWIEMNLAGDGTSDNTEAVKAGEKLTPNEVEARKIRGQGILSTKHQN